MLERIIKRYGIASFLFSSTIVVNIGNYALYLLLGRYLGPEEFAASNIIATMVLVLSFIALSFQLTSAKYCTEEDSKNKQEHILGFISWMKKFSLLCSILISILCICAIEIIQKFLNFSSPYPLLILFLSIPVYFRLCVLRGYYQGVSSFKTLALTYLLEMVVRFAITFGLIYLGSFYYPDFIIEIVAFGFFFSFLVTNISFRVKTNNSIIKFPREKFSKIAVFFLIVACYELSRILVNNCDVVMVKHYFNNTEAGLFASMALIGKVVFFATFTIVTLLFPKVIELKKKGKSHTHLFWSSLTIVAAFGILITLTTYFFDQAIMFILFGEPYLEIGPLLWQYCLATTIFSCANVFVYYHMSLDNYQPVWISLIVGVLEISSIYFYHGSIQEIVNIQLILMTALLLCLLFYHNIVSGVRHKLTLKVHNNNFEENYSR